MMARVKKIFLVGDNRFGPNWGGRGAGIALQQLLEKRFHVSGVLSGSNYLLESAGYGYIDTLMPPRYNWVFLHLLFNQQKHTIFDWYIRLEKLLGAKDFLTENPGNSVDNIFRHRKTFPALDRIIEQAEEADAMVINGEGDFVLTTPPRRQVLFFLAMMELGLRLRKRVFLVNSMISDCPETGRNLATLEWMRRIFPRCDGIFVRDDSSRELVQKEIPGANTATFPDSLFTWMPHYEEKHSFLPANGDYILPHPEQQDLLGKLDFSKPYICIGGGALSAKHPDKAADRYGRLIDRILELGYPVYLTENDGRDSFLSPLAKEKGLGIVPVCTPIFLCGAILAQARLFISGRYHPTIFASFGGTPCIFLGTTAHKMSSLQDLLGYPTRTDFSAFPTDGEIDEIKTISARYLEEGEHFREHIREATKRKCQEAMGLVDAIEAAL